MGPLSVEQVLAAEVDAMRGPENRTPRPALHKFVTAQKAETARADKDADARSGHNEDPDAVEKRKEFYRELNKLNRAALCCSGGGIRSATFCLGVIQALAKHNLKKDITDAERRLSELSAAEVTEYAGQSLLSRMQYLSTVSGGGYIGSWLSAWRTYDDFPTVWESLSGRPDGPDVEPAEISWLRAYSSYLTPQVGLGSADTWAAAAIFLRNLLLNWLVIVPAVAVVLLVLKIIATISVWFARLDDAWWPDIGVALVGAACLILAQAFATAHRPARRAPPPSPPAEDVGNIDQRAFWRNDLLWSVLSAIFITSFLTSAVGAGFAHNLSTFSAIAIGAGFGVVIFAAGWVAGWPWRWKCKDWAAWAGSGLIYGGLLGLGAHLYTLLHPYTGIESFWIILLPIIFGVPWVLISQLFAEMVFVGLTSYEDNSEADREWLGRCAGWVAAAAVIWALTTFLSMGGAHYLIENAWGKYVAPYIASCGGIAGIIAALIGKSSKTPAKPGHKSDQGFSAIASKIGLAIAGPVFAAALVIYVSVALDLLLLGHSLVGGLSKGRLTSEGVLFWLIIGLVVAYGIAWIASYSVNINRFSLHALYRNRLVRAYLGASRQRRCPDKFTGFDGDDNLPMHRLWPPKEHTPGKNTLCLFHVVNITLNVVKTARLAWQQRKAESFTVSPLHSGSAYKGYRPSIEYGGGAPYGVSLGTAMAISGAAASPNMGYHSSPSITLLLALFNVRLGWWLGNPGAEGERTYKDEGPKYAIKPLADETFGQTTDTAPYVYLSDGGHFENLGLYEMVRRRCRYIIAIDAGCDPDFAFEDLGNAVRKIFIDLGIRITFTGLEKLKNRPKPDKSKIIVWNSDDGKKPVNDKPDDEVKPESQIPYHAIGRIHYMDADGGDSQDGQIIYIKPAVHFSANEGAGVRSYANASETFPHETTANQFFTESQFESYRSLGLNIANTVLSGGGRFDHGTVQDFLDGLAQEG